VPGVVTEVSDGGDRSRRSLHDSTGGCRNSTCGLCDNVCDEDSVNHSLDLDIALAQWGGQNRGSKGCSEED